MKEAGKRLNSKSSTKAAECGGAKIDSEPAVATSEAAAAAAPSGTAFQSLAPSPTDRQSRQQQATSAPSEPAPPLLSAVAVKPRACKYWRTAAGCREFRHDDTATGCDRGGGGGSDAFKDLQGETPAAEVRVTAVVCGARGEWRPGSSGATIGADAGLSGFGVHSRSVGGACGDIMKEDGGVDELIGAMSKLMVPRHLRARSSSARRDDPIG